MRRTIQRVRQQHRLGRRARRGTAARRRTRPAPRVRAGEHGERLRRQPPPPLPQQRLDPADLRREVVRDEQVLHGVAPQLGAATVVDVGRAAELEPRRRRPAGVLGEQLVVAVAVAGERRVDVRGVAGVGRRCRARPARCAAASADRARRCTSGRGGRAAWRRRPSSRSSTSTHGLRRRRRARPCAGGRGARSAGRPPGSRRSRRCGRRRAARRSTGIGARPLQHPGQAAVGVDDPRRDDRPGRAARRGTAGTCRSRRRPARRRRVAARGDDAAEHEPAAGAGDAAGWRSCRTSRGRRGRRPRGRRSRCRRRTRPPARRRARSRRAIARSPARSGA